MIDPILITGCARSGTSMTAGIIYKCGAFGGKLLGGDQNNPKGYFENLQIRETITKPLVVELGGDRLGQSKLPKPENLKFNDEQGKRLRDRMASIMISHGYTDGPWFYKGAKMCLIWPIYHIAFPKAKWIIVRRPGEDIVNSCLNTSFMGGRTTKRGWYEWLDLHKARWFDMIDAGLNVHQVHTDEIVKGNYESIHVAVESCGLKWNGDKIENFVEPKFWKRWSE